MPKAYSYKRFSTPEQSKGDSLRRQSELSEKYAKEHGLDLDTSLKLTDLGVSAFDKSNITKGTLGIFLRLIEDGKIEKGSHLLVESLDRISRAQILDALNIFTSIINAGITIVSLKENIAYSRESITDNWTELIVSIVSMSRAGEESSTKSFRGRAAWDNKRANINVKRLTGRCPYWLKPNEGHIGFQIIPERVEVVKKIFDMAKNGMGTRTITRRLNQTNTTTFSDKTDGWQDSYVQKILRNKAIYGEFQMNTQRDGKIESSQQPINNYYPVIISKEEWTFVNSLRTSRKTYGGTRKGKHLSNLFSGLLKCGYCGSTMTMGGYAKSLKTGKEKKSKYVACSKARRGIGCLYSSWNYDKLESEILTFCHSVDFAQALGKSSILAKEAEDARKHEISIKAELIDIKKNIQSLISAIEKADIANIPSSIVSRISELESKSLELKTEHENAEKNATILETNVKSHVNQKDAIIETIIQLKTLEGTQLHDLRIRLSSQINQAISKIALYPNGVFVGDEQRKNIHEGLIASGYSETSIDEYFLELQGGHGKHNKFITLIFNNGNVLQLSADTVASNFYKHSKQEYLDFVVNTFNQN